MVTNEGGRHHREVEKMARAQPGIVGDIDIARLHALKRYLLQKVAYRSRHGIHMAGCAGNSLGQHPPIKIKDACRKITCFTYGR